MSQQIINVGATANDGTGDTLRLSQQKANDNFTELYGTKLDSIVAGTNVTIDNTDPLNPIVSSTGGGGTQNLNEVLVEGNTTGGENISISSGDSIILDNGSLLKKGTIDAGYGGAKGISQICAVGYELKWEAGRLYVMGDGGTTIREVSHNFTTTPTTTDDIAKGFVVGSRWILDNGDLYICTDNTSTAAVWVLQPNIPTKTSDLTNDGADGTNPFITALDIPTFASADKMVTVGRNSTGATLYKGTIVYISGSTGNRPNFVKARANAESTSAGTFGVIQNDIANNSDGNCVTIGTIDNLDTRSGATHPFTSDTLADGDTIYLSPTTAGYITNTKPSAPNHLVYIGKVVRTSPTNGTIVYRIQNGYELDEIHDVAISSVANNDLLIYESSTSLWKNKTITAAMLPSGIDAAKIDGGNVSNTEFSYLDGVTSSIQTQINGKLGVLQVTPITLTTGGWSLVSGLYEYTYSNANILSTSIVDVIPASSTISIVKAADIMPATSSAAGSAKIYATNLPTASITVTINIYN